jgi:hypothetical protein
MVNRRFSSEQLTAYVDGEAEPALAAEIAAAAGADPGIAAAIAAMSRLKAASRTALEQEGATAPPIRIGHPRAAPLRSAAARLGALAASLVLVVVLAAAGWYLLRPVDATSAWLEAGAAHYAQWRSIDAASASAGIGGRGGVAQIALNGTSGYVPDLSAARMQLAHVAVARDSGDSLFVGYVGRNGCRLGLWIGPAPDNLPAELVRQPRPDGSVAVTWRVGGTGYAALARDMDEERFQAVLSYLHASTRQGPGDGQPLRMAGRDAGAPCLVS